MFVWTIRLAQSQTRLQVRRPNYRLGRLFPQQQGAIPRPTFPYPLPSPFLFSPPFPISPSPSPFFPFPPSPPAAKRPPWNQLGGLGSAVSSGIRIDFGVL